MSPSYSGSTLLTFLLANHPRISTIGELKASAIGDIDAYICSCGEKFTECSFWQQVIEAMRQRGRDFSLDHFGTHFRSSSPIIDRILRATVRGRLFENMRSLAMVLVPGCRAARDEILSQNKVFIEVVEAIQEANHFLDGSKDPIRLKHLEDAGLWDIRVIRLVRDGRGVANSYMNHMGVSMEVAAKEWVLKCKEMNNVMAFIPADRVITVHYEDLCRDVEGALLDIFDFIGLDGNDLPSDFNHVEHHILGNSMRLRSSGEVSLDEKWRRMLSHKDLDIFYAVGGDVNSDLGYER
ncbi:MAG TPA: sulfotransferase [Gammaproteobacteria bacterium]|nr:sulfotransferase [Gammaproteobacteria bacterium]